MAFYEHLPPRLRDIIKKLPAEVLNSTEELRLRIDGPLCLRGGGNHYINAKGHLTEAAEEGILIGREDIAAMLALLSQSSLYAFDEELRRGYITIAGGHRAGLCGHAVLEQGHIRSQRDINAINFRIAHEVQGAADGLLAVMRKMGEVPPHTLIISPPGCGKTTVLRDMACRLSDEYGLQVGIVDERSEIAAYNKGKMQLNVGRHSDVIDACPKAEGIMLLLRSMSPQVIICDEIGRQEDISAVREAVNAGVKVITTAHAASRREILARPAAGELLREHCFDMLALYSRRQGAGTLEQVWNAEGRIVG